MKISDELEVSIENTLKFLMAFYKMQTDKQSMDQRVFDS